jgi:hypothetical protein
MQKRSERVHEMTKVDDLVGPRVHPYVPLCIQVGKMCLFLKLMRVHIPLFIGSTCLLHYITIFQDPRSYFDSQRPNLGSLEAGAKQLSLPKETHPAEALSAFSQQCEELHAKVSVDAAVVPDVAARVVV